jgi:drug/metabolite transporter (DMT)-like permease
MVLEKSNAYGAGLALIAALGFSLKAIFVKLAYAVPQAMPVDASTLLSLRMVFALPVFLWVGIHSSRAAPPLSRRDWGMLVALGLLGYYGASILDFIGLRYISAGLERLILFTYPTLTVLIGVFFMGKQLSRRELGALLLSYAGIGLAFVHDLKFAEDLHAVLVGAAFVFASALSYAFYLAGSGGMIQRLGAARFTALAMLVSTVATQLHFFVSQPLTALIQPPMVCPLCGWRYLQFCRCSAIGGNPPYRFGAGSAIRTIGPMAASSVGSCSLLVSCSNAGTGAG